MKTSKTLNKMTVQATVVTNNTMKRINWNSKRRYSL